MNKSFYNSPIGILEIFIQKIIKLLTIIIFILMVNSLMTGCTNIKDKKFFKSKPATTYFHRGVYKSYTPDKNSNRIYFYVFYDKNSGHTEDIKMGIGLPFSCIQKDGYVKFKFGGSKEPEEKFKIKSAKNKVITGYFKDKQLLKFILIPDANPDKFDTVSALQEPRRVDEIIEPVYTQDCFPKTLEQCGVSKKCFENANLGQNKFCTETEIKKIKEYYKKGQDKDPLNDGSGNFCAD